MSVTDMEHVLVLSDDIDRSREFYCRVVGLRVGDRPPLEFPGYWLYAGETPCLHIAERRAYLRHAAWMGLNVPHEPPGTSNVDHIAFNASDYEELTERLDHAGVEAVRNHIPGVGLRQLFFDDPNGVRIEINVKQAR
ncbi:MAG: VOC family protein [Solirubrobacteraceae bacterium]|jgi:catechol 2,3-dioxygenase-like lactoylglutathione lyase family enzyme